MKRKGSAASQDAVDTLYDRQKTVRTPGPSTESIFQDMEREDILKEVSKYPPNQRKALFRALMERHNFHD